MSETYSLRPATTDDFEAILAIERQSYPQPWTEDNFQAELSKPFSQFLVVTDDETDSVLVGYLVLWFLDDCQILNITVNPEYRRRGFAKMMIRHAIKVAHQKEVKKIHLEVRKSNQAALELYQGLNFVITHMRKGFYENGEDAYQMTLHVEDSVIGF